MPAEEPTESANEAVFARELRTLYEEDVEDAGRKYKNPLLAEMHVLLGICMLIKHEQDRGVVRRSFYRRRRELSVSGSLAGLRAMHLLLEEVLAFGDVACETAAGIAWPEALEDARKKGSEGWPSRFVAISLSKQWMLYRGAVLDELRLPVTPEMVALADKLASAVKTSAMETISMVLSLLAEKSKKPSK